MVNTSIYLQSVPLPAVWPLYKHFFSRLFISVWFLLLQRFTIVLALSTLAPSTSDLKQMFQEARAFFIWFLIQIYSLFSHLAYSFAASGYHFSLNLYLLSVLQVGRIKFWRIVATNKKDFFKTSHNSNFSNSLKRCQLQFGWKLSHPQLSVFRSQSVGYSHNFTQTVPAQT